MKALILNSGKGSRMGMMTAQHPKCMTEISTRQTILSRQLEQLYSYGIENVVITTGLFDNVLVNYCQQLELPLHFAFVKNPMYEDTNYIYSIYCAKEYLMNDDILLLHGDMVFENEVLEQLLSFNKSCMAVSSTIPLPMKDFKAVLDKQSHIKAIGVEYFNDAVAAMPMYRLSQKEWELWMEKIEEYCGRGETGCYAEKAYNDVSDRAVIYPLDVRNMLCAEIDTPEDLQRIRDKVQEVDRRVVYMSFSADIIHSGHISIIKKAARLGKLIIGVLTDEVVASYKRFPLLPFEERKNMFENISGVYRVVEQDTLSYRANLEKYRPDYVVHGDDWVTGTLKPVRDEVLTVLGKYGGKLVEYPYRCDEKYVELEKRARAELATPEARRKRLKRSIEMKGIVTALEAHSGLTGLLVENTVVHQNGQCRQFDAMWVSSLCDSTAKGKPDIELVDLSSRLKTIDEIMDVTTKPIIFDGDTGGLTEHFVYTVRSLERMGVSMIVIEDKTGLKKNSLFGTEVKQTQDSIENFSNKIRAGKSAQKTQDFMICARIESLILEQGMEDALQRAFAYVDAGADAIMIHSRKKDPSEIFEFLERFRENNTATPVVLVPTSYNTVTEEEFKARKANIIIYANQLTRISFPAMQEAAQTILQNHRAKECDDKCMSIQEIIELIPEE